MGRAARSVLLASVLSLACGALTAVALAASGAGTRHHHPLHTARVCHRSKHRDCPKRRAASKTHPKHTPSASSTPAPQGLSGGSGSAAAPTTAPAAIAPGSSTSGSEIASSVPAGGTAPAQAPTGPAHVQVTAEDTEGYRFVLSRSSVPAGPVIIEFVNHGQDEHNLHAIEPTSGTEAGSLPNTLPGAHPQLKLNLSAGSYTLFCSLPGHEAKGMKATLAVN
jgi:plastocyanin